MTAPVSWPAAEPAHLAREQAAVSEIAPDLVWAQDFKLHERYGLAGFTGALPRWCAARAKPDGVDELLGNDAVIVEIIYSEATPMVPPAIRPITPDVPVTRRTQHRWHVNGDGTLCQLQGAAAWTPGATAADLIIKASCWYVEYQLMERDLIETMSENGIATDTVHDVVLASLAP